MNWIRKSSSFKYSGTPVTRVILTANTPLGIFKCYEAVSGRVFVESPFGNKNIGLLGFIPDPENEFGMHPRIECSSLQAGVSRCNEIYNKVKNQINEY